MLVRRHLV
jgi:hypothetical protein